MNNQDRIVRADAIATGVFAITAVYAAVVFDSTAQWVGSITAMVLFVIGIAVFLYALWVALQRSRYEQVSVAELFMLMGPGIPSDIKRVMNGLLLLQTAIALVTTFARPNGPGGNAGSSLAVGLLVPMLGFGLNGLWAATHGRFTPRELANSEGSSGQVSTTNPEEIRQNARHG